MQASSLETVFSSNTCDKMNNMQIDRPNNIICWEFKAISFCYLYVILDIYKWCIEIIVVIIVTHIQVKYRSSLKLKNAFFCLGISNKYQFMVKLANIL